METECKQRTEYESDLSVTEFFCNFAARIICGNSITATRGIMVPPPGCDNPMSA